MASLGPKYLGFKSLFKIKSSSTASCKQEGHDPSRWAEAATIPWTVTQQHIWRVMAAGTTQVLLVEGDRQASSGQTGLWGSSPASSRFSTIKSIHSRKQCALSDFVGWRNILPWNIPAYRDIILPLLQAALHDICEIMNILWNAYCAINRKAYQICNKSFKLGNLCDHLAAPSSRSRLGQIVW